MSCTFVDYKNYKSKHQLLFFNNELLTNYKLKHHHKDCKVILKKFAFELWLSDLLNISIFKMIFNMNFITLGLTFL